MGYAIDGDATFKTNPHTTYGRAWLTAHGLAGHAEVLADVCQCTSDTTVGGAGVGLIIDKYRNRRHVDSLLLHELEYVFVH
jgi:hypothetical protein